jgi:hypothetical protein
VSASLFLVARDASAYRPFDGRDADVAEFGDFELELGPTQYYREGDRNFLAAPATPPVRCTRAFDDSFGPISVARVPAADP